MASQPIVIIGSGLAGYTVAREFRKLDTATPLLILSADHGGFYSKPMLSNAHLQKKNVDGLLIKSRAQMADELKAEIRPHARVTRIDPLRKEIIVNEVALPYHKLVLALGADPIRLALSGDGAPDVLSVNDLDDYRVFRGALAGKTRVAILGAGLIGCEFANDLTGAGYKVDVIDLAPQVLGRLLPPASAAFMQRKLEEAGVRFHLQSSTVSVERTGGHHTVSLSSGTTIETDVILSAVGLRPRVALALAAGITINRGVTVDTLLQTSAEDVYALGDCAEVAGKVLPYILPIMHAARALASTLSGKPVRVRYPHMPVAVKTPACPAVILAPDGIAPGNWLIEENHDGVKSLFYKMGQELHGFALLGSSISDKNYLIQSLPLLD
ncbi:MAG: FAD-dependent oxidoreductase [Pseudomonadota bacterium]